MMSTTATILTVVESDAQIVAAALALFPATAPLAGAIGIGLRLAQIAESLFKAHQAVNGLTRDQVIAAWTTNPLKPIA